MSDIILAHLGFLPPCPRQAHNQYVSTHDAFPHQSSLLDLTWTASLVENCNKKIPAGNLRPQYPTEVQSTVNVDPDPSLSRTHTAQEIKETGNATVCQLLGTQMKYINRLSWPDKGKEMCWSFSLCLAM